MEMSEDEVSFEIDFPELENLPREIAEEVLVEVGEYLRDTILDYVGDSRSPVSGGKFRAKLSPKYAEREGKETANLDMTGAMLDSLVYEVNGTTLAIGVFDSDQAPKAYNHNVGDTLPQRQFIPLEGQSFKREIMSGIRDTLEELIGEFQDDR